MPRAKKTYIAVFGKNKFECLRLLFWSLIRGAQTLIITPPDPPINALKRMFLINRCAKNTIKEYKAVLPRHNGLWYEMHKETIDLTTSFYNEEIKKIINLVSYYNNILNTNKMEAYFKKETSRQIFALLRDLHFIRLSDLRNNVILLNRNSLNEYVVVYLENRYGARYQIKWIPPMWIPFSLSTYYGWLFKEFIGRGLVFNKKRKNYKISEEAAKGFDQKTLRNDMLIDNNRFKSKDILILQFYIDKNLQRNRAFSKAKERGFDTVSLPRLKINVNENIFNILFFYFLVPLYAYLKLLLKGQSQFFYYIFLFHKRCFPAELLMNLYRIKCHISTKDWGDVEETIILNKYGAENVILHWSDLTIFKPYSLAFNAHNTFFGWGDIHYDYHRPHHFIDKKVNIGCIYKREYNNAVCNKQKLLNQVPTLKRGNKTVVFFDNNVTSDGRLPVYRFLKFLEILQEFCEKNKQVNVLLKPKDEEETILKNMQDSLNQYKMIRKGISSCDNFNYLYPLNWSIEEAIAISDVCVSIGMSSPSTIALICGRNALYFEDAGNIHHPFAKKYKDVIVFEDKELLFQQIGNILNERFNCRDVISEREVREYDAFDDDDALERLKDNLFELTKE